MKKLENYIFALMMLSAITIFSPLMESYGQTTSKMYVVQNSAKYLQEELISKDIRDANGDVCAAVVISSDLPGLAFQSYNGIVKTNNKPGRNFIFVSPTERVIEVFKSGFEPLKIILNDYGIKLKSGQVWELKLSGDKKLDLIPIIIRTDQIDAQVFIDYKQIESNKTQQVEEGKHLLHIEKEGYVQIVDSIVVSLENILFEYKLLKIELVNAQFKSNLPDAKLFIDGVEIGRADLTYKILPGIYKIKLTKPGYIDYEKEITVSPTNRIFTFNLIKNLSQLRISLLPKDATVELNGRKYVDIDRLELEPGFYNVKISHPDYRTITESLNLEPGIDTTKTYNLIKKQGVMSFTIEPSDANITFIKDGEINNSWLGEKKIPNLPVGQYQVICKAKNYKSQKVDVIINDNETTTKHIIMDFGVSDYAYMDFNVDSNYDIYIDGNEKGSTSAGNKQIETGEHSVELRNNEESVQSVVYIDGSNSIITIGHESKTGIIWRSALLPGFGQINHGRTTTGAIYMGAFVGTAAYFFSNYKTYNDTQSELDDLTTQYNSATDPSEKYNLGLEINNKQSDLDDAYDKAKTSIWLPIGIYAISLLDAIFYPTPKVIQITDNRTLQIIPNLALSPNGGINAGVFVRF